MEHNQDELGHYQYVIYARKSSEEEGAQINSIDDQVRLCREYADRHNLDVLKVITEEKSAKYANNRPKFAALLEEIENGEVDGIIAYHPDRVARNMLEAGKVLDMLTPRKNEVERRLKALRFSAVEFSNDSSGRMMLAVLFSMATQFSEHLSEVVKRGVDSNLNRGISAGTPKWGYNRNDATGYYEPNEYFEAIRAGWDMLLDGKTQLEIVQYWEEQGVHRMTKISRKNRKIRRITISEKMTPTIFRDPFFCGILRQSGKEVNLCELQPGFKPMITEDEYNKVQEILGSGFQSRMPKKNELFLPLKGMVFCDVCGRKMYASRHKGMVYYECQNKECERAKKSIRGKDVFDAIYGCLGSLNYDGFDGDEYAMVVDATIKQKLSNLKSEQRKLNGIKAQYVAELKEMNERYAYLADPKSGTPSGVLDQVRIKIASLEEKIANLDSRLNDIENELENEQEVKITKKLFLNLLKTAVERAKCGNFVEKDEIVRSLFSNLRITNENSLIYLCKPEFNGLFKHQKIYFGAPD